ncbi:MAG: cation:proton antiporter [Actinobacteria bacterium]|nr:MAG: cation:proton antiporter [Actinomycetota bacterium]
MIDTTSFLVIVAFAAFAGVLATTIESRLALPVVVVELLIGILIGPQVLALVGIDRFTTFFSDLGLGMLFFFAGYEIDFEHIRGRPLWLGLGSWVVSLALAYSIGGVLATAGIVLSLIYTGSALATTAIGTLIPVLRDKGELHTRFGTYLLAAGAAGEFGPIMLVTLVLSGSHPLEEAALLIAFVALAVLTGLLAVRSMWRGWSALERTFEASSQLAVRLLVVLVFGLATLADQLGLDILLGGFVAGLITRAALRGHEVRVFESKMTALGYGLLIPFFFLVSGMKFDGASLISSPSAAFKLPLFLVLMLIVRGTPALLFYRGALPARDRLALAFYSATALPLVVAITSIATSTHHMRESTAASLVGAAILSTLIYPLVGAALRRGQAEAQGEEPEAAGEPAAARA